MLKIPIYELHAQMQQRQRLKNLDRFKNQENCILVATDVASRGLDVSLVKYVIHYHLPTTVDLYVHRSGRTARAKSEGLSLLLLSPEDVTKYILFCNQLNKDNDVKEFPIEVNILYKIRKGWSFIRKLDKIQYSKQINKEKKDWLHKNAKDMDIALSDEEIMDDIPKKSDGVVQLRNQLSQLLPLCEPNKDISALKYFNTEQKKNIIRKKLLII